MKGESIMNNEQIENALHRSGMPIVTVRHVEIVNFLHSNPGASAGTVAKFLRNKMHMQITDDGVYKAIRRLKEAHVLTNDNEVAINLRTDVERNYPMVSTVTDQIVPPVEYQWVHLAGIIAKMPNKTYVLNRFREQIQINQTIIDLFNTMHNGLAFCAMMKGDVSNFSNMQGELKLDSNMQEFLERLNS